MLPIKLSRPNCRLVETLRAVEVFQIVANIFQNDVVDIHLSLLGRRAQGCMNR